MAYALFFFFYYFIINFIYLFILTLFEHFLKSFIIFFFYTKSLLYLTFETHFAVVIISLGAVKKEMRTLEVAGGGSPKHRASICATTSLSMDATLDSECDIMGTSSHVIQHQQSLDQSTSQSKLAADAAEAADIVAEPLEKILEYKLVKEKRMEMEKKLESMRKKHDKEKIRVSQHRSGDLTEGIRKSKFYMNNKLVKRLSSKNM